MYGCQENERRGKNLLGEKLMKGTVGKMRGGERKGGAGKDKMKRIEQERGKGQRGRGYMIRYKGRKGHRKRGKESKDEYGRTSVDIKEP